MYFFVGGQQLLVEIGEAEYLLLELSNVFSANLLRYQLLLDDFTVEHPENPVGVVLETHIVGHHYQGDPLVDVQVQQDPEDVVCVLGVEISRRFIQQQDFGLVGQRSGDGDSLLLSS